MLVRRTIGRLEWVRSGLESGHHVGVASVSNGPIVLKKSKVACQKNLRKSGLIADFGWRCPLKVCGEIAD